MTGYASRVERGILRLSPLYVRAERLRVATALRRESLPDKDLSSWWRGAGTYAAIALFEDSRFYPGNAPAPTTVRVALRVVATLTQGTVSLAAAPYCGVLVGLAYLRYGQEAALDQAARNFLPLYAALLAGNVAMWVGASLALSAGLSSASWLPPPAP